MPSQCYTPIPEAEWEGQRHESGEYTKDGVVIPSAWVKGWGKPVSVRRGTHMVILESPERKVSRQRLGRMIRKLRRAAQELGPLTPEQIAAEVAAVRTQRARRP